MPSMDEIEPFTTKNLVLLPEPRLDNELPWIGFQFSPNLQNELLSLGEIGQPKLSSLRSDVLRLDTTEVPPLSPTLTTVSSATRSENGGLDVDDQSINKGHEEENGAGDIWERPDLLLQKHENRLVSWDHFNDRQHVESTPLFISEAGPTAFDILLCKHLPNLHKETIKYARQDILLDALFEVGVGRSSIAFEWKSQSLRFEPTYENFTTSGLSLVSVKTLVDQFLDIGAQFRRLRQLRPLQRGQSPAFVALQTAVNLLIDVLEQSIESARFDTHTFTQLQNAYTVPSQLLNILDQLVKTVRNTSSDKDLIMAVLAFTDRATSEYPYFERAMHTIVLRIMQPVLKSIEVDVGLSSSNSIESEQEETIHSLLPASTLKLYTEIKSTFRVLQAQGHDFVRSRMKQCGQSHLIIKYSLQEIIDLERYAECQERSLQGCVVAQDTATSEMSCQSHDEPEIFVHSTASGNPFVVDLEMFHKQQRDKHDMRLLHNGSDADLRDQIFSMIQSKVDMSVDMLSSCYQAIDLSIRPLLRVQHRLLSYSCIQMLFQEHNFVSHTRLLGRFHLLSDGTFVSKLSSSLFDAEQFSGEGRRRMHTRTGLRLQSRETWPPATSELRLALMGILTESMSHIKDDTLTNSISFAIRDLSDEDLERCRDIDSIYALDFLRLNYKPSNPVIEAIITPNTLDKYDRIFNQLLRLLRMQVLTQSMLRTTRRRSKSCSSKEQKFRIEAQRLISALAEYYQCTVITTAWSKFETQLDEITNRLNEKDYDGTLELASGLEHLREMHEDALETVTRGMLLKRRQSEPKGIIDRLFEVILRFAATTSKLKATDEETTTTTISRLHMDFKMHMKALVRWLMTEAGHGGTEGSEMFEQLLLKLDWNGYWSR